MSPTFRLPLHVFLVFRAFGIDRCWELIRSSYVLEWEGMGGGKGSYPYVNTRGRNASLYILFYYMEDCLSHLFELS